MDEKPHVSFHSHDRESFSLCGGLGVFSRDGMPVIVMEIVFVYFLLL